jgi:hypothetical protein
VPAGLVENDESMGAGRRLAGDRLEMLLHGEGVGAA